MLKRGRDKEEKKGGSKTNCLRGKEGKGGEILVYEVPGEKAAFL